ncbi:MAG: hypothetical protein WD928_06340 [Gammaproteobacteria bacterium]
MRLALILSAALIITGGSALLASSQADQADAPEDRPVHEQILALLRMQDAAVTRVFPELHPFQTPFNREAPIPPQCYTKTEGHFNPCYVCHQAAIPGRENVMNDVDLQVAYSFSDVGMTNHWSNLFEDRTEAVAAISNAEILEWINEDNYSALPARLVAEGFDGWIPDLDNLHLGRDAFDAEGFAKDGSHWVAFNYKPLPSTFWPTNGSTDDVMIRLAEPFRSSADGAYSRDVYKANLAIAEARLKGFDSISTLPVDEAKLGTDLDGDGTLGVATRITAVDRWVGAAAGLFNDSYLYPQGTEFLHTVRYVGIGPDGKITVSPRMKEVRYMRKWTGTMKMSYSRAYQLEHYSKELGRLPAYAWLGDHGLDNGYGWSVQGFIEGHAGELRTLTYEENLFCMGCHSSIGATIDKTFSFPRKVDGAAGWGYINLHGMPDAPNIGETRGEIATYLERVGGGGEFRNNPEMARKWLREDGSADHEALAGARDVYDLITPSPGRALLLNKAYRVIVAEQDYIYGRDATVMPPQNVHEHIDNDTAETLPAARVFEWDIRLDWDAQPTL